MLHTSVFLILGLTAILEVTNEPVAIVVDYGTMQNITLKAEDVLIYSNDIPGVTTVEGSQATYAKRSMAQMMAANVPEEAPENKPTPPNESRFKKRLDHTPPFTGTVVGKVTIVKSAPNQRVILISDLQGDGIMQVLIKGNTAQTSDGKQAAPLVDTPKVLVRNSRPQSEVVIKGASEKALTATPTQVRTALQTHYKGTVPNNLRVVSETVQVK